MKLHLSINSDLNTFTGYGDDYVAVNQVRHMDSMIVLPEQIIEHWQVKSVSQLDVTHFEALFAIQPEIILLGTGTTLQFPERSLVNTILMRGIGFEVMDTQATCRTYNILSDEGRQVAAAILINQ